MWSVNTIADTWTKTMLLFQSIPDCIALDDAELRSILVTTQRWGYAGSIVSDMLLFGVMTSKRRVVWS